MQIPFIKYSKIWFSISGALVISAITATVLWGLKPGIDFTGGSLVELHFNKNRPTTEQVQDTVKSLKLDAVVQKTDDEAVLIRTSFLNEEQHKQFIETFKKAYEKDGVTLSEARFETIGASVSSQLRRRAFWGLFWVIGATVGYIAYAFRGVSRPVASWKYGVIAVTALVFDIMVVVGTFSALGYFAGVEVEIDFVLALLTVLGFSVTDRIVVFDRIRENVLRRSAGNFGDIVNMALNETLMRSVNSTFAVLLPLFALYFLGGETIKHFALALLVGMGAGAFSSIFIASPLLVAVERWQRRKSA